MKGVHIRPFTAHDTDWVVERHATLYAQDEGFDESFGPLVAKILAAFNDGHDPETERGWIAEAGGERLGSIFCVRHSGQTAKLRLFLVVPAARGSGVAQRLLETCMTFAKSSGYTDMTLWTHESHKAACALYARNGWTLTDSRPVRSFGQNLVEQTWTFVF